ncbi:NUDIX domain-containing protein [Metabacillus sp. KIGAM252]|uniref:NUDIX domain-containing protein n=1 Tax=Metabacillus flavus TaxID=2823519 RepID=A0ABS5LB65_9BACI|nr:NUDIX domain-containing protein [Metabacillus flavus]MBS2967866.1 NUDIX domain-containing protein [Metabacillus flavus]
MKIEFYDLGIVEDQKLDFAVISAYYKGQWVYVRHRSRQSWEIPGGDREQGETIEETAGRELFEETGTKESNILPICDYSMDDSLNKVYGRLYFARINGTGPLPDSEIEEAKGFNSLPNHLTYPEIQPMLYGKTIAFMRERDLY